MGGTTAAFAKVQKRQQLHAILPSPPQSKASLNAGKLLNVSPANQVVLGISFKLFTLLFKQLHRFSLSSRQNMEHASMVVDQLIRF